MTCMKRSKAFHLLTALACVCIVSGLLSLHPEITRAQEGEGDPAPKTEAQRRLIILYGYWPPTDIGVQGRLGMLDTWKAKAQYKTSNYDVLAITPEFPTQPLGTYPFPNPVEDFWGKGTNRTGFDPLIMDYRETAADFWSEMATYKPIAIMAFGRGEFDKSWVLEPWGKNLRTTDPNQWYYSITYSPANQGNPVTMTWNAPYGGGSANDPSPYGLGKPGAVDPKPGNPPDPTKDAGAERVNSLPTGAIVQKIGSVLPPADVAPTDNHPGGPGTFVCNFMAYLVAWWKEYSSNLPNNQKCKAAGFTHVGGQVTVPHAKTAVEAQLDALVEWLDAN